MLRCLSYGRAVLLLVPGTRDHCRLAVAKPHHKNCIIARSRIQQQPHSMSGKTLLLFGGTGATGSHVPTHALALGMKVVMFVRTPSKISESYKTKVEPFEGSMDDLDAVCRCVQQHKPDFILFTAALPRGQPFKPLSSAVIPAICNCLKTDGRLAQVRIAHLGGYFSLPPGASLPFCFKVAGQFSIGPMGLQGNISDASAVIQYMCNQADVQMVSIRMWNVGEGPTKGTLRVGPTGIMSKVTFTDMASFMVKAVSSDQVWGACCRKAVEVTY